MAIEKFSDEYRFLSNFWTASVVFDGIEYKSVEYAYQAAKTLNPISREAIRLAPSSADAKGLGNKVLVRKDWNNIKIDVMRDLVTQKFHNHLGLKAMLLETGDEELIEGNHWGDTFWGICNGRGENWLGKILMDVRSGLKNDVRE